MFVQQVHSLNIRVDRIKKKKNLNDKCNKNYNTSNRYTLKIKNYKTLRTNSTYWYPKIKSNQHIGD